MNTYTISRNLDIPISKEEMFRLVVQFTKENPEVTQSIIDAFEYQKGIINNGGFCYVNSCPFPFECHDFPCKKLSCNADVCSNGHAYRMS